MERKAVLRLFGYTLSYISSIGVFNILFSPSTSALISFSLFSLLIHISFFFSSEFIKVILLVEAVYTIAVLGAWGEGVVVVVSVFYIPSSLASIVSLLDSSIFETPPDMQVLRLLAPAFAVMVWVGAREGITVVLVLSALAMYIARSAISSSRDKIGGLRGALIAFSIVEAVSFILPALGVASLDGVVKSSVFCLLLPEAVVFLTTRSDGFNIADSLLRRRTGAVMSSLFLFSSVLSLSLIVAVNVVSLVESRDIIGATVELISLILSGEVVSETNYLFPVAFASSVSFLIVLTASSIIGGRRELFESIRMLPILILAVIFSTASLVLLKSSLVLKLGTILTLFFSFYRSGVRSLRRIRRSEGVILRKLREQERKLLSALNRRDAEYILALSPQTTTIFNAQYHLFRTIYIRGQVIDLLSSSYTLILIPWFLLSSIDEIVGAVMTHPAQSVVGIATALLLLKFPPEGEAEMLAEGWSMSRLNKVFFLLLTALTAYSLTAPYVVSFLTLSSWIFAVGKLSGLSLLRGVRVRREDWEKTEKLFKIVFG